MEVKATSCIAVNTSAVKGRIHGTYFPVLKAREVVVHLNFHWGFFIIKCKDETFQQKHCFPSWGMGLENQKLAKNIINFNIIHLITCYLCFLRQSVGGMVPLGFPVTRAILWDHSALGPPVLVSLKQYR